jgi:hypothetical protein
MTTHAHDPSTHRVGQSAPATIGARSTSTRSRWLLPALAVGIVAAALVVAGVVSLSTVLYAGLFGGMILMHVGGHGDHGRHGGHAGPGSHSGHGADASRDEDLSRPSPGSQPGPARSTSGLDDRASGDPNGSETHDHDQRNPHSCH